MKDNETPFVEKLKSDMEENMNNGWDMICESFIPVLKIEALPRLSIEDIIKEWKKTGVVFRPIIKSHEIKNYEHLMQFRDLTEEENKTYLNLK